MLGNHGGSKVLSNKKQKMEMHNKEGVWERKAKVLQENEQFKDTIQPLQMTWLFLVLSLEVICILCQHIEHPYYFQSPIYGVLLHDIHFNRSKQFIIKQ